MNREQRSPHHGLTGYAVIEWDHAVRAHVLHTDRLTAMRETARDYAQRAAIALASGDLWGAQHAADIAAFGLREWETERALMDERETRRIRAGKTQQVHSK